jgi:hypothetical protein
MENRRTQWRIRLGNLSGRRTSQGRDWASDLGVSVYDSLSVIGAVCDYSSPQGVNVVVTENELSSFFHFEHGNFINCAMYRSNSSTIPGGLRLRPKFDLKFNIVELLLLRSL